jgi:spermidine synthase
VKPWVRRAAAPGPDGNELTFDERDGELVIRSGGVVLMSSARHGSEEAMAAAALEGLDVPAPSVLIGGLGLGFTLRAALDRLPRNATVWVAELSKALVEWSPQFAELTQGATHDPRVTLEVVEVGAKLARSTKAFDAVLLDVDNGPSALSRRGNQELYSVPGLDRARQALKPGGVLVVWSAGPDGAFMERLRKAGFDAQARQVLVREGGRAKHTLFIARATSSRSGGRRTPERTPPAGRERSSGRRPPAGRAR